MRRFFLSMLFVAVSSNASAAFTCEKIKDKATRVSCIEDRVAKENAEAAEKERTAPEANEKAAAAERKKDLDDFVQKAKRALTQNYKDPAGAQYTDLVVAESRVERALCGSVNGKNSYGAYVGARRFSVSWIGTTGPIIWNEFELTEKNRASSNVYIREKAAKLEASEDNLFKLSCLPSETVKVTKIEP